MRDDFALIPVIDLKDGGVVHARAGKRADYRPLETPFGLADDPVAIDGDPRQPGGPDQMRTDQLFQMWLP